MTMYALVEQTSEDTYTASLIGWPAVTAQGGSEDEAVGVLHRSLAEHLQHAKIMPFNVGEELPWLQTAGVFTDDLFAEELDSLIADYRRSLNAEELRISYL